jgi:hypothetical protein
LLSVAGCRDNASLDTVTVVSAEKLTSTDVLPHTEGTIVAGRNYVYCSTFQLAWNELGRSVIKEPLALEGSPPLAEMLSRGPKLSADDLPCDGYIAKAGLVREGVVQQIREDIAAKFPRARLSLPDSADEQAVVAYAYLEKSLPFAEAFDRLSETLVFHGKGGDVEVNVWGVRRLGSQTNRERALKSQVTVLDYEGPNDFLVQLNTESAGDQLVLAKVSPKESLAATLAWVIERARRSQPNSLSRGFSSRESLVVPIISLGVSRRYEDLLRKRVRNAGFEGLFFDAARQCIRFRLDETGARLASTAYLGVKSAASLQPREFIFDRPFLLYIRRTGSDHPYLVLWIENEEILQKAG